MCIVTRVAAARALTRLAVSAWSGMRAGARSALPGAWGAGPAGALCTCCSTQLAGGGRAQQAQPFAARSALNPIGLHRASWRGAHRAPDVHVLDGLHARNLHAARPCSARRGCVSDCRTLCTGRLCP